MNASILKEQVLSLPKSERELLAQELLFSLEELSEGLQEAWVQESAQRMKAYREGLIEAHDGQKVLEQLK